MISVLDIKQTITNKIKEVFPAAENYHYYGVEVKEGYIKPCFFTQLLPVTSEQETVNTIDSAYLFTATYIQKVVDETDQLEKVDAFKRMFIGKIAVADRYVQIKDFDFEYVGRDRDILQMSFTITFKDVIERQIEEEAIKEVSVNTSNE